MQEQTNKKTIYITQDQLPVSWTKINVKFDITKQAGQFFSIK